MLKLKNVLKWSALSLALSLLIIFSARAQTSTGTDSGSTTQTHDEQCISGGGKLCKSTDGVTNWCSYSTSPCPAYDTASCSAQGGEWCAYSGTTGGWCTGGSSCPIMTDHLRARVELGVIILRYNRWQRVLAGARWRMPAVMSCTARR